MAARVARGPKAVNGYDAVTRDEEVGVVGDADAGKQGLVEEGPTRDRPLRFCQPTLPPFDDVQQLFRDAYNQGLLTNGALTQRFEREAASRRGVRHCVALSSCTSGLILAIRAMDLTGEVILPSFTFIATGEAVLWNGLRPVFADCQRDTWTLDPDDVQRKITPRTSAIIGVHVFGNPCDTGALAEIARSRGVRLLYDAAHAFGSFRQGVPVGGFGDAEVFSLTPTKTLVAGEGGIVATNDGELAERIRLGRNYGDGGDYDPELLGLNARMEEFSAALALGGLHLIPGKIARQNAIAASYRRLLAGVPGVTFQHTRAGDVSTFKDCTVLIDPDKTGTTRDAVARALLAAGIPTKKYFFPPLHRSKLYASQLDQAGPLPNTDYVSQRVLSLPIYPLLSDQQVELVARTLAAALGR